MMLLKQKLTSMARLSILLRALVAIGGGMVTAEAWAAEADKILRPADLIASGEHTQDGKGLGEIWNGDRKVADVVGVREILGKGKIGTVIRLLIRDQDGKVRTVAAKVLNDATTEIQRQLGSRLKDSAELLSVLSPERATPIRGLNLEQAGLTLKMRTGEELRSGGVILSEDANGSVDQIATHFELSPKAPDLTQRIWLLRKFAEDGKAGLSTLARHGLVHNDVKPGNVLYVTEAGFDWITPDPDLIHFKLADFDAVSREGEAAPGGTPRYFSPEMVKKGYKYAAATAKSDAFSLASSLYRMAFGAEPFVDYLSRHYIQSFDPIDLRRYQPHGAPDVAHLESALRKRVFSDPDDYSKFLAWVDERFRTLEHNPMPQETRGQLDQLRGIVVNGMNRDPALRSLEPVAQGENPGAPLGSKILHACERLFHLQ